MRKALFVACLTDALFPANGQAVVRLLERLGHQVEFPEGQTCCGQMHFNTGYRRESLPMARGFADAFAGSDAIVSPSASCAAMVREYYGQLADEAGDARLARAVTEIAPRVRPVNLADRRARCDRRGRVLPAPGHLPPDLPLAANAPGRRRAAAAAARGPRACPPTSACRPSRRRRRPRSPTPSSAITSLTRPGSSARNGRGGGRAERLAAAPVRCHGVRLLGRVQRADHAAGVVD